MRSLPEFDDESEFVSYTASVFREYGWDVDREVTTDCGTGRADLVVQHRECGPIGIESKYVFSTSQAKLSGEALEQIGRYQTCRFDGESIGIWALCPYHGPKWPLQRDAPQRVRFRFMRGLFNSLGIGYVRLYPLEKEIVFERSAHGKISVRNPPAAVPYNIERKSGERGEWLRHEAGRERNQIPESYR